MRRAGHLSEHFVGIGAKVLAEVEANPRRSNQHEFNGVLRLKALLGDQRRTFPGRMLYLTDRDEEPLEVEADLTWYDAREAHATRTEWRFYYPGNAVTEAMRPGDLCVIGRMTDDTLLVVIAEGGSTVENQVRWLFGIGSAAPLFEVRTELDTERDELGYAARAILESIGVETTAGGEADLDLLIREFGGAFPETRKFSAFARSTVREADARDDPDRALVAWMAREDALFRTLERHLLEERLKVGFAGDVEGFLAYSLSVQNRRKSRAGRALESHVEAALRAHGVAFERNAVTENQSKPDFLFPGEAAYHDAGFDAGRLAMLAVKSTCKDRWRQVLAEAARIPEKHLLTLEAGISVNQTAEMAANRLQLVLPAELHATYRPEQRGRLMRVAEFVALVKGRAGVAP